MSDNHPPVRLFASDIEDTLIGDRESDHGFKTAWQVLETPRRPLLVYNSGCSVAEIDWMVLEHHLPSAEFIIGSIGTEVHDPLDVYAAKAFCTHIASGWDRGAVQRIVEAIPGARPQASEFLNNYKLSWHWPQATRAEIVRLEFQLRNAGLDVSVIYSSSVFLDVIPSRAGKGNALAWLCRRIGVRLEQVVVAGAGANNVSMFALPGVRGIAIGNSSSELLAGTTTCRPFLTPEKAVNGVLAGLRNYGLFVESTMKTAAA